MFDIKVDALKEQCSMTNTFPTFHIFLWCNHTRF